MKAYQIKGSFGLQHLALVELPDPVAAAGEVLVRVRAASINHRDLLMIKGLYNPRQKLPLIPCSDGAGEVVAIGTGVSAVKVGDRVCSVFAPGWASGEPTRSKVSTTLGGPVDGMLTELRSLPEAAVLPLPAHLSFEEGATLPCAGVTAWRALVTEGQVMPGETVLVQGTGGVSLFALQIAKLLGARVIVTSSSDEKLARARALGAALCVNYVTQPEWHKEAKDFTAGVGVDHVVDVGGASTLERSLKAVRMGGHISVIGVLGGNAGPINLIPILMQHVRMQGVLVGSREDQQGLSRSFASQGTKPILDRVFDFGDAVPAFEHMASGKHFGKIVVKIGA